MVGVKYNRTNKTKRLNRYCLSIKNWGDVKIFDRWVVRLRRQHVKHTGKLDVTE